MDLHSIENRLMVLECLKENAHNMLVEQVHLRDRISIVLARARNTLASIRTLNTQVREMKVTVENVLAVNFDLASRENMWPMIEGNSVGQPLGVIAEEESVEEEIPAILLEMINRASGEESVEITEEQTLEAEDEKSSHMEE